MAGLGFHRQVSLKNLIIGFRFIPGRGEHTLRKYFATASLASLRGKVAMASHSIWLVTVSSFVVHLFSESRV